MMCHAIQPSSGGVCCMRPFSLERFRRTRCLRVGYARGRDGVRTGYARGMDGVCTVYAQGTHRVRTKYARGYARSTHGVPKRYARHTHEVHTVYAGCTHRVGSSRHRSRHSYAVVAVIAVVAIPHLLSPLATRALPGAARGQPCD